MLTYYALMDGYCLQGQIYEARRAFDTMFGISLFLTLQTIFVQGCTKDCSLDPTHISMLFSLAIDFFFFLSYRKLMKHSQHKSGIQSISKSKSNTSGLPF